MIHFKDHEFNCKCGCGLSIDDMDEDFLYKLDRARNTAEVPFVINSAIRCTDHNREAGGSKTSSHPKGCAVDIKAEHSFYRFRIVTGLVKAGITRLVIYPTFVHCDDDPDKPTELMSYRKG